MNLNMSNEWMFSLLGGAAIGTSAVFLMAMLGRIAGISGIASDLLSRAPAGGRGWRLAFVVGLIGGPLLVALALGDDGIGLPVVSWPWMALAGLLVGFGTRLGGGCTSGHGVCGLSRLSPRSVVATVAFMLVGVAVVFVIRHVLN